MEPVLRLADVARWAGQSVDRVREWWTSGLLGGPDADRFESTDVERAKMLGLLARRGVAAGRIAELARGEEFGRLVSRLAEPTGNRVPFADGVAQAGLDAALAERLWRASGLPFTPWLDAADVEFLGRLRLVRETGLHDDALVELARVFGDAMRRIAETQARLFHFHVQPQLQARRLAGDDVRDWEVGNRFIEPTATILQHLGRRLMAEIIRENWVLRLVAPPVEPDRLTAAIAFVDLCSFTPLAEAMGDRSSADVLDRFSALVRDVVAAAGGRIVKQIGDAFMLAFGDARSAVAAAVEIDRRAALESRFPAVRAGIHWGAMLFREGDYVGATVNVAARVADQAGRHQIVVTDAVRAEAGDVDGVRFVTLPPRTLKGVPGEVALLRAERIAASSDARVVDPVCGMEMAPGDVAARLRLGERELAFCSPACLQRYVQAPTP